MPSSATVHFMSSFDNNSTADLLMHCSGSQIPFGLLPKNFSKAFKIFKTWLNIS